MLNANRQPDSIRAVKCGNGVKAAIVILSAVLLLPAAQAAGDKKNGGPLLSALPSPSQMLAERTVDGTSFLQDMAEAVDAMKGYSFTYDTTVYKGGKTVKQEGQFYFKQPRLIRVEMTGSYKRGAVAVLGKDGKVRGHLGGALSPFTMTLSPDSDMLVGANGYPLIDSDFGGMVNVMKRFQQQGCKVRVTDNPVSVEGQPAKVYTLEFYQGNQLYKRAYIDPKSLLPVEWFDYQNGQLFARTVWKNVKMDQNIADAMFQL